VGKVFVITPVYCTTKNRRQRLLLESLYSVRLQSHPEYLHVVVDDGSTDDTKEVLERIAQSDPRLMVLSKKNGGSSEAVNFGIQKAAELHPPDYITLCHSDDLLLPRSLDHRVQLAEETGADFIFSDVISQSAGMSGKADRTEFGQYNKARTFESSQMLFDSQLDHVRIPYMSMLWRGKFFMNQVKGYDPRITSAEDWDIALRTAKQLVATGSKHATLGVATGVRRSNKGGLELQNIVDGTKELCYEMILEKHLSGRRYTEALEREYRLLWQRYPGLLTFQTPLRGSLLHRLRVRTDHALWRWQRLVRPKKQKRGVKPVLEPLVQEFLKEIDAGADTLPSGTRHTQ